ncbi:MAG TPA: M28 family peptidase [Allosphingosinicella sp.]|nr:M28 family peptidase [Allosphingosinicella sp.]
MRKLVAGLWIASLAAPAAAQAPDPVQASAIREDVRVLASDAFQGRGPGERGETATLDYLRRQFEAAGLSPGGPNNSWYQDVPLIRLDHGGRAFQLSVRGQQFPLQEVRDWSVAGSHEGSARIAQAPLVFVGFGIHAPELGWDDYAGADLTGKIAVMLPNEPDFDAEEGPFGGRARTRYASGKPRAAFDRGAVGVLFIHRTALTSWPWQQRANSDPDPTWRRAAAPAPQGPTRLSAWITDQAAARLFDRAGLSLEAQIRAAQQRGFRSVPLPGVTLNAAVTVAATPIVTRNILARLDGTTRAEETVVLGAHWDAYGEGPPDATGDRIRNGAVDNAIGTATMLEVARAFARAPRTQRSLLFIGYTAEEDGLLGAYEYVSRPSRPLETTALALNLDPHLALPRTRSVELIGAGRTELEGDLARLASAQGRRIEAEADPSAGWYFRSDHYAFAEAGVPTVYFRAGRDLEVGGSAAGRALVTTYNEQCYHQRCDEFDPAWDMAAAQQDGTLVYNLMREVADSGRWPGWNAGTDFARTRDKSRAARR